ncbi:MAG: ComEC/Rec2 family competence protein [Bacteroidales bacterium]
MQIWHPIPFVRLLLPFAFGIVAAIAWGTPLKELIFILTGLLAAYLLYLFIPRHYKSYKYRWVSGVLINLILFLSGYQLTLIQTARFRPDDISHHATADKAIIRITEPVEIKERSIKVIARPLLVCDSVTWKKVTGKVMLYFEKDSLAAGLEYGDCMLIQTTLQPIQPPLNPAEFDYRRHLSFKGIYCQAFVKKENWEVLRKEGGHPVKALGIGLRKKFLVILEENGLGGKEYAVASAILLGYDENLDAEQRRQFAGAGAMHILCVSGLHVGIIYLVLSGMLGFMQKKRWLRVARTLMLLMSIWFYALVTGFSPSVLRASTMFSFIIIGSSLSRKPNIYNSLAGSAFLLLAINPYMITSVGFQLSYLAVLGIVTIYRPVYTLFIPDNWLADKIWSLSVVSLSATLATFALTTFYFNQFPNLFAVTNLIAIPASTLILYTGILVLITSPLSFLSNLLAQVLTWVIRVLNFSVGWIEGLSFSTLKGLYLNSLELFLVFLVCFGVVMILLQQKRSHVLITLAGFCILMVSFSFRKAGQLTQQKLIVYHVPRSSAIEFINGRKELLLADSAMLVDDSKTEYHIRGYRTRSGIRKAETVFRDQPQIQKEWIMKSGHFIWCGNKIIALIDPEFELLPTAPKMRVDYLILTGNPRLKMEDICRVFEFSEVIFDSSNAFWMIDQWKKECEEHQIVYHAVSEAGARVIEL